MQPEEAQAQPEAPDAVYHATAAEPGEKVSGKTVPEHRGTRRVLEFASPDRNTGKIMHRGCRRALDTL